MLQNAISLSLGKSAPWPPNISDAHVSCTEPATRNASLQLFFKGPTHAIRFSTETKPSHFTYFWQGAESIVPATKNDAWASKNGSTWCALPFWLRNVLRATTGSTFLTAQLPKVLRRWGFHFEMCFAPWSRALFQQLNCQKCSDTEKHASRHSRVIFARLNFQNSSEHELPHASAPAALASLLFDPLEPQNIAKRQCLAT